jgi:hypothetical protein
MASFNIEPHDSRATAAQATQAAESAAATAAKRKPRAGTGRIVAAEPGKPRKPEGPASTKTEAVLKKLRLAKGATIDQLMEATGWQAHSVRGFLSGTVRKKLGLALIIETGKDGVRRYRIDDKAKAA